MRPRARWMAASTPTASASLTKGSHKPMGRIFRDAGSPAAAGGQMPWSTGSRIAASHSSPS
eukprot:7534407-Pyramimonas_sp.AAC.1